MKRNKIMRELGKTLRVEGLISSSPTNHPWVKAKYNRLHVGAWEKTPTKLMALRYSVINFMGHGSNQNEIVIIDAYDYKGRLMPEHQALGLIVNDPCTVRREMRLFIEYYHAMINKLIDNSIC